MPKVVLTLPWTDRDGKEHKQSEVVEVDEGEAYDLVFLGRARAEGDPRNDSAEKKVK